MILPRVLLHRLRIFKNFSPWLASSCLPEGEEWMLQIDFSGGAKR